MTQKKSGKQPKPDKGSRFSAFLCESSVSLRLCGRCSASTRWTLLVVTPDASGVAFSYNARLD